ncbi:MAG: L-2-amino-thiazoline-4-carboxylic acid hydrolase [Spirochaetaceae bacterium]|jgi:hypothetical protein|nr:L-2-amino-thiazoline-4-carboxylic acid hydrolase [Spirochaetaceae bacterium]
MSGIVNVPKKRSFIARGIRKFFEHRAMWMFFLLDEAKKKGLNAGDFAPQAIRRCGIFQGTQFAKKGRATSLKVLKRKLFKYPGTLVFEMKFGKCSDDNFDVFFHYCPLVSAWQSQGCNCDEIAALCDYAMCGDRGIAESFGCELDLPKTIARGDDCCHITFKRKKLETD